MIRRLTLLVAGLALAGLAAAQTVPAPGTSARIDAIKKAGVLRVPAHAEERGLDLTEVPAQAYPEWSGLYGEPVKPQTRLITESKATV